MNTDIYMEEIRKILSGETVNKHTFRSVLGEKFLGDAVMKLISQLIEIKQEGQKLIKSSSEGKLLNNYRNIKELLGHQERMYKKELHLNSRVLRLFTEGDALDSIAIKKDVISNAEDWIYIIKKIYEKVNIKNLCFFEDMIFWKQFHEQIMGIRDFSRCEEYKFISDCLDANGSIVVKYTLESLFLSEKIYKLSFMFLSFYSDISCDFISKYGTREAMKEYELNNENPIKALLKGHGISLENDNMKCFIDCDALEYEEEECFIRATTEFLSKLMAVESRPKVIKKTVYRLINHLRLEILCRFYLSPHEKYYEVLTAYNQLLYFLNERIENTTVQYSVISMEDLVDLDSYRWDIQQICTAIGLLKLARTSILVEEVEELSGCINHYYRKFCARFFTEIRSSSGFQSNRIEEEEEEIGKKNKKALI